jgi:hypothetical protein
MARTAPGEPTQPGGPPSTLGGTGFAGEGREPVPSSADGIPRERRVEVEHRGPPSRFIDGMLRRFERAAADADEEAWDSITSVLEGVRRALDAAPDGYEVSSLRVSEAPASGTGRAPAPAPGRERPRRDGLEARPQATGRLIHAEKSEGSGEG